MNTLEGCFIMNIDVLSKNGAIIIKPGGNLDASTVSYVEPELLDIIESNDLPIILDMSEISYMSSEGLRLMVSLSKKAMSKNTRIVFSSPNQMVNEILHITMFYKIMHIFPTTEEALNEVSSI